MNSRGRPIAFALAVAAIAALCPLLRTAPLANSAVIAAAGALLSWHLGRKVGGAFLARVVLGSYLVVAGLAVGLYLISAWELPLLPRLQLGGGFWTFGWDALSYDRFARQAVGSWIHGTQFPSGVHHDYFLLTALLYLLLGPNPLNAVMTNALFHSAATVSAFSLGRRIGGEANARASALLVGFWPSLLLWSAQLLKDALVLLLVLLLLDFTRSRLSSHASGRGRVTQATRWTAYFGLVLATYQLRWYLVLFLAIALAVTLVVTALACGLRDGVVFRAATLLLVMVSAASVTRIDFFGLVASFRSEAGYARLRQDSGRSPDGRQVSERRPSRHSPSPYDADIAARMGPVLRDPLRQLNTIRRGSIRAGGSLVDPDVEFHRARDVLYYLPRGIARALFSPYPSDWLHTSGRTGPFKAFASVEAMMMYVFVVPLLMGVVITARSAHPENVFLLTYILVGVSLLALTIANLGTLIRLRLEFLMPGMALVGVGLDWLRGKTLSLRPGAQGEGPPTAKR